jgi:hypothetical protein
MNKTGWTVAEIEIEPNNGATVTLTLGGEKIRLHSPEFGVGRPGREAAALAKFAARSGLGPVRRLYEYFACLPNDYAGPLNLPLLDRQGPPLSNVRHDRKDRGRPTAPWDCVLVDY